MVDFGPNEVTMKQPAKSKSKDSGGPDRDLKHEGDAPEEEDDTKDVVDDDAEDANDDDDEEEEEEEEEEQAVVGTPPPRDLQELR